MEMTSWEPYHRRVEKASLLVLSMRANSLTVFCVVR